jgi:hypothetical protein
MAMGNSSILYWSPFKTYEDCPQQFLWSKGWEGIDCGGGVGNPKPNPNTDSKHHAAMGIAIQYAIEKMYNDELYRDPANLVETMKNLAKNEFLRQEAKPRNFMDWKTSEITRDEALQLVESGVVGYLRTMRAHKFIGSYSRAEVNILGWIDSNTPVGGRADVIIRRDDTGISILDGKNTKHKMKYTDPDQLRWYALIFKLANGVLPDRIGFVWYRFPFGSKTYDSKGEESIESGVEWISFDENDLRGLAIRVLEAKKRMSNGDFSPTPVPNVCKFCDYEEVCEARISQRAANSARQNKGKASKASEPPEMLEVGVDGFMRIFTL